MANIYPAPKGLQVVPFGHAGWLGLQTTMQLYPIWPLGQDPSLAAQFVLPLESPGLICKVQSCPGQSLGPSHMRVLYVLAPQDG